ncbi:MAG: CBS domain-containing protein [Ferruginibacter sp.]
MLTRDLINNNIPRLQLQDSVGKALQLINDFRISHLPVVSDNTFLGLISEDDLLDAKDEKLPIEVLHDSFLRASVPGNVHFLNAVNSSIQFDTTVVAVSGAEDIYEGVISIPDLLKMLGNFAGANEIGGIIVMEMERSGFAISEISRIVESNDCTILHMNTIADPLTGLITVTLHINKRDVASVVATFQRYEYNIVYALGDERSGEEINTNYDNLMKWLNI